eukprot:CAMPEP_0117003542 /NCGR_PEP_ID=MMETSP0472-20121206/4822_1 /TAXON_ID=693140 ORGANISM="Tiarina fusus, Strain LIS" /NCGR_SAMPLE_ID=MMETSP0472 /ASSEMBLY_ACC=CAM_ASM_000603 /LENGTH=92 /DNA_ID=CAMNT_0004704215 /DNA_START=665 /DNA_END=939 /DNA_ORIENTATION=-
MFVIDDVRDVETVGVGVFVTVGVGELVFVGVLVCVCVGVPLDVRVRVGELERVRVGLIAVVDVRDGVGVCDGVLDADLEGVNDKLAVGEMDG